MTNDTRLYETIKEILNNITKEDIQKIIDNQPSLLSLNNDLICDRINYLLGIGFTQEELLKVLKLNSSILTYTKEKIEGNIEFFQRLGYTKSSLLEMIKQTPA
ncbi:MAG: hypothetical protein IKE70_04675, partial [Bacilli bacterium]|nr:hypothetical protein [Bacilli bacterium]